MYRKICLVVIVAIGNLVSGQDAVLKDCYYSLSADTVTVGNRLIERQWLWKQGNLVPLSMTKKSGTAEVVFSHTEKEVESLLGEISGAGTAGKKIPGGGMIGALHTEEWVHAVPENTVSGEKLLCELIAEYPDHQKKTMISVSPGIPAIRISHAFRKINKEGHPLSRESDDPDRLGGSEDLNINKQLDGFYTPSLHYNMRAVEFFDQTDGHNNLVLESNFLPFRSQILKRGNLLFASANTGHASFFLLKEAPCSSVQLHYPGHDFFIQGTQIAVSGTGVAAGDLAEGGWINTYAVVSGVQLDNYPLKYSLRLYQKSIRKHESERDDMIMLNTWGDRNRDQSINEAFCKREIDACKKFGFTHFQIDDGWQKGLSSNSGSGGKLWDEWEAEHWQPNPDRFPNGFQVVVDYAKKHGIQMGLWFHPSNTNGYEKWERDAVIVVDLYREYGVRYFKIDGIKLPDKRSEVNFRRFLDLATELSEGNIVFNLDATANNRGGYHFLNEYGNIFLENRYTDWRNYFPHWTLRNLWQLSEYVPPERLQIEFLNVWRNADRYEAADPLSPSKVPFEYAFAIAMAAQPLAWLEGSNLPSEAGNIIPIVEQYRKIWDRFHNGYIFPIGQEPNGTNWTGFQSVVGNSGYILVFRELNEQSSYRLKTLLQPGEAVSFRLLAGDGKDFEAVVNEDGEVEFGIGKAFGFGLYEIAGS